MVEKSWLTKVDFPGDNHHVPPAQLGADAAAAAYALKLGLEHDSVGRLVARR